VYYRREELESIREWLAVNYDKSVKSVSFLLHSDHNFPLPPYEEINADEYAKISSLIDFSIPMVDTAFSGSLDLENCDTGVCPVK